MSFIYKWWFKIVKRKSILTYFLEHCLKNIIQNPIKYIFTTPFYFYKNENKKIQNKWTRKFALLV